MRLSFGIALARISPGSPEYTSAFSQAASSQNPAQGKFWSNILRLLSSQDFKGLAPRTQSDMRKSFYHAANGIDARFGDAPLAAFDDPRIRRQALDWRNEIGGKVGDDRIRHLQRLIAFALDRSLLRRHQLLRIKSIYKSQRAEIFWMPEEIETFQKGAPAHVWRILAMGLETGLRPGDLAQLSREHIHRTPQGHRIVIWTQKRKRMASIPVTPRMAELLAATPAHQERLIG